ncbi:MAG: glycosyltransferase family 2 protein [Candidatus Uhrbacteria bacterium]|nr:glycosyltransferase family 2 protein [Candidatus Uhrbacteria bacterium]
MRARKTNDYSSLERVFTAKTGKSLCYGKVREKTISTGASIIVPVYENYDAFSKCFAALQRQKISKAARQKIEIIVVDDASSKPERIRRIIKSNNEFSTLLITMGKNHGRSVARNAGLAFSKQPIAVFVDADIVTRPDFLINHLVRHQRFRNIVTIGFRDAIPLRTNVNKNMVPDFRHDFRFNKFIPSSWESFYIDQNPQSFDKTVSVVKESDNFKKFSQHNRYGVWGLPGMFVSSNCAFRVSHVLAVGGFSEKFHGWGMEDTFLGYKLMRRGVYFVPLFSATTFHLTNKKTRKDMRSFKNNYLTFLRLTKKYTSQNLSEKKWRNSWLKNHPKYFTVTSFSSAS